MDEINKLLESNQVEELDEVDLEDACGLINEGGQLSWTLTPSRLKSKLGNTGKIFGLFINSEIVGTIGLKETSVNGVIGAEVGYLYLDPDNRSFTNYVKLYSALKKHANKFNFIYATTVTTNRTINRLMEHNDSVQFGFSSQSPFSSNILNYWIGIGTKMDIKDVVSLLKDKYMINESISNFKLIITNFDKAPNTARPLQNLAKNHPLLEISEEVLDGQVEASFGRNQELPISKNKIVVGNKYYNKQSQYSILKGKVPLLPTFDSPDEVDGEFIAKKINSQKQQGQMINKVPDNPSEYIFQPLVKINSEYRVVVYFMNGDYHVSGVYEKFGSNMSFGSITSGQIHDYVTKVAIKAVKHLGYGLSGVDIVMTNTPISESAKTKFGGIMSKAGRLKGALSKKRIEGSIFLLECNTLPSLGNPMIMHDFITSVKKNKK